jgi:hypothetical protein
LWTKPESNRCQNRSTRQNSPCRPYRRTAIVLGGVPLPRPDGGRGIPPTVLAPGRSRNWLATRC